MFYFSILLLAAGVVLVVLRRRSVVEFRFAMLTGVLVGAVGLLLGLSTFVYVVEPYQVGVPTSLGSVGSTWQPGLHLKTPLTEVTTFSTRPSDLNLTGNDTVEVRSSEGGVLYVDLTVKWSIDPQHALALYKLSGSSDGVQQRLVYPDTREIVRNVFAKHTSVEGYASQREVINSEMEQIITGRLAPRGIIVNGVNLRNVKPSDVLQKAIDQKIQQDQATEQAAAAVLTAKAEAEKRRIEAESQAQANTVIANSLTDRILMSQCIDAFKAAAEKNPVYASPCGSGAGGSAPLIVDGTKR
ncbi:prohibitin family protein [Kitasatospora sp. NPDC048540]|uniref:prohibitin family protein n=1 Tax=unclassified Kitasatospora TaxID=2633591 RepID=UPI00053B14B2|nr:prohibitin family protein [Kitasatospora sp. MBT63]